MKIIKINVTEITIVAILVFTSLSSCKKSEINSPIEDKASTNHVGELKIYLSQLTGSDTSKISYDAEEHQFLTGGIGRISLQHLDSLYRSTPIVSYEQGLSKNHKQ